MTTSTLTRPLERPHRPAATAAARLSRASLAIGALGLATALFLITRLAESWRIGAQGGGHTIRLLGHELSYPAANAGAIVVVALAALGLAVALIAVSAAITELIGSHRLTRRLARHAESTIEPIVIDDPAPYAFCAGLVRARVYITTGALEQLDPAALTAVLDHERHHARRRDPLRSAAERVLARSLFFLPGLARLHERRQTLAELGADESAAAGGAPALARAMLAFAQHGFGFDPARIDYLTGTEPPSWRFPAGLVLVAATVIGLLGATAALAAQTASGTATLNPPFLSHQPCIVVLATIPAGVALLAWRRLARMRA